MWLCWFGPWRRERALTKSFFDVFRLVFVLTAAIFLQTVNMAHSTASPMMSSHVESRLAGFSQGFFVPVSPEQVVATSSDPDGCEHLFVANQTSWECHHPVPLFLLSSSIFIQGVLSSEKMADSPCFPDLPFSTEPSSATSYHSSSPDRPPRVS